jgi:hypothetical protein
MTKEPHIGIQIERISRIAKYLPRDDLETFLLNLVENFLERENAYAQWVERLNSQSKWNI